MLRRLASSAALVAAAVLLAGCTPPDPVQTTTPATASPSPLGVADSAEPSRRERSLASHGVRSRSSTRASRTASCRLRRLEAIATPRADREGARANSTSSSVWAWHIEGASVCRLTLAASWDGPDEGHGTALNSCACWTRPNVDTTDADGEPVCGGDERRQPRLFELSTTTATTCALLTSARRRSRRSLQDVARSAASRSLSRRAWLQPASESIDCNCICDGPGTGFGRGIRRGSGLSCSRSGTRTRPADSSRHAPMGGIRLPASRVCERSLTQMGERLHRGHRQPAGRRRGRAADHHQRPRPVPADRR